MLRLFLLRHANAPRKSGQTDRERKLDEKGYEEACSVNVFLKDFKLDMVIASDAVRVKQTITQIKDIPEPNYIPQLYNAEAPEVLIQIKQIKNHIRNLMVVGHNPGITSIIDLLNVEFKDANQFSLTHNFNVTAKLVILNIQTEFWNDVDRAIAKVETLFYP